MVERRFCKPLTSVRFCLEAHIAEKRGISQKFLQRNRSFLLQYVRHTATSPDSFHPPAFDHVLQVMHGERLPDHKRIGDLECFLGIVGEEVQDCEPIAVRDAFCEQFQFRDFIDEPFADEHVVLRPRFELG